MPSTNSPIVPPILGGIVGGLVYFLVALLLHVLFSISDWWLAGIGVALILFASPKLMNAHITAPVMILVYVLLTMAFI